MNKLEDIAIRAEYAPCCVCKCREQPESLIVASRESDIRDFRACGKHKNGVYGAVLAKFAPQDYMIACYNELSKKI